MDSAAVLALSREAFADLVDRDVRGRAPADAAAALRTPEVAERWYQQLVASKKSAESQLAARSSETKANRLALLAAAETAVSEAQARDLRRRSLEVQEAHLRWKAGTIRFRAGVEASLSEASVLRRVSPTYLPVALLDERAQLLQAVATLRAAIQTHRDSFAGEDEPDEADRELWGHVAGRRGDQVAGPDHVA